MHEQNDSREGNHSRCSGHLSNPISQKTHQHRQNEGISHKIRQPERVNRLSDPLREKMCQCGRLKLNFIIKAMTGKYEISFVSNSKTSSVRKVE